MVDISKLEPLKNGEGAFGKCYIVNEKTLYKRFKDNILGHFPYLKKDFARNVAVYNETFVFPDELDLQDEYVAGYFIRYIHAKSLFDLDYDISISDIINSLEQVKKDIKTISNMGILAFDISYKNVLFNECFSIIDTDSYVLDEKASLNEINKKNESLFVDEIYNYLCEMGNIYQTEDFIYKDGKLVKLYLELIQEKKIELLKDFLSEMKKHASSISSKEIDNLKQVKKLIIK